MKVNQETFSVEYRHCVAALVQALKRFEQVCDCTVQRVNISAMDITSLDDIGRKHLRRITLEVSPQRGEWEES